MFNVEKCMKCCYHGTHPSMGQIVGRGRDAFWVYCNYACVTGDTCLKKAGPHDSVDSRGNDPDNCKLFWEGEKLRGRDE